MAAERATPRLSPIMRLAGSRIRTPIRIWIAPLTRWNQRGKPQRKKAVRMVSGPYRFTSPLAMKKAAQSFARVRRPT
ncbi:hypothetical protein LA66_07980 [Aureimonas altamirensis]|uniref:Uncharacterized protein n=1 Tax=Aureimonas altamirensis TaxID=370622 RepID=A0A0B1Q7T9_9HYPH|nr:hypothetical protein LA66_07980 [Aureimonas altamirensis]